MNSPRRRPEIRAAGLAFETPPNYQRGMPHITQAEARVLAEAIRRRAAYMLQLRERMAKTGRTADPLNAAVREAAEAMHTVWVHAHYRACGVSRPPEPEVGNGAG